MGFNINYIRRVAKTLNLSENETRELIRRMNGHLQIHGTNKHELLRAFFVIEDIYTRKIEKKMSLSAPEFNFKHKGIIAYKGEIVSLLNKGYSSQKIYNSLQGKRNCPSLATIKRYIKQYKDWRCNNVES